MYKVAAIALSSALGIAGLAQARPAEAHPCPPVLIAPYGYAPAYYGPAAYAPYYVRDRFWHRGFDRERFEHFHRDHVEHWDRR